MIQIMKHENEEMKTIQLLTRSAKWSTWLFGFDKTAGLSYFCGTVALSVTATDALDRLELCFNTIKYHSLTT